MTVTIAYMGIPGSNSEQAAMDFAAEMGWEDYDLLPRVDSRGVIRSMDEEGTIPTKRTVWNSSHTLKHKRMGKSIQRYFFKYIASTKKRARCDSAHSVPSLFYKLASLHGPQIASRFRLPGSDIVVRRPQVCPYFPCGVSVHPQPHGLDALLHHPGGRPFPSLQ